jgi:hypothetical protein
MFLYSSIVVFFDVVLESFGGSFGQRSKTEDLMLLNSGSYLSILKGGCLLSFSSIWFEETGYFSDFEPTTKEEPIDIWHSEFFIPAESFEG